MQLYRKNPQILIVNYRINGAVDISHLKNGCQQKVNCSFNHPTFRKSKLNPTINGDIQTESTNTPGK